MDEHGFVSIENPSYRDDGVTDFCPVHGYVTSMQKIMINEYKEEEQNMIKHTKHDYETLMHMFYDRFNFGSVVDLDRKSTFKIWSLNNKNPQQQRNFYTFRDQNPDLEAQWLMHTTKRKNIVPICKSPQGFRPEISKLGYSRDPSLLLNRCFWGWGTYFSSKFSDILRIDEIAQHIRITNKDDGKPELKFVSFVFLLCRVVTGNSLSNSPGFTISGRRVSEPSENKRVGGTHDGDIPAGYHSYNNKERNSDRPSIWVIQNPVQILPSYVVEILIPYHLYYGSSMFSHNG